MTALTLLLMTATRTARMSRPGTSQRPPTADPQAADPQAGLSATTAAAGGPAAGTGPVAARTGPVAGTDHRVARLRVDLGYDGSAFHGWAAQPGLRTVQEVTQDALGRLLCLPAPPVLTVAGRTDAGVHARGQVAHADVPADAWQAAEPSAAGRLNRLLPADIRIRSIAMAPDGFDARFAALSRRYSYRVCDDPAAADPLRRHDTLWFPRRIDIDQMNQAGQALVGEHDFAAFCRRREGATTIRAVLWLEWARAEPGTAVAMIAADAFCHNMVRALVGAMLAVGDGRREPGWLAGVLAARTRDPAVHVAPPHPLCLEEVRYPPDAQLPARAIATRRVRQSAG